MGSLTLNTTNGAINLVPADGSGTQTLNIGRQPNLGKVLQMQHNTFNVPEGSQMMSLTTTSFIATPITITITPKSITSKLLIETLAHFDDQTSNSDGIVAAIYRDGNNITMGGYSSGSFVYNSPAADNYSQVSTKSFVSSNSLNSTTFTLYIRTWTGNTIRFGSHAGQCHITVWEIEQ